MREWFCPRKQITEDDSKLQENSERLNSAGFSVEVMARREKYGDLSMKGEFWRIDKEKYSKGHWKEFFKEQQQVDPRYLTISLSNDTTTNIVKQIYQIKFPNLRALYLQLNNIGSVECLSHLQAPLLMDLDLRGNKITRIRSLRKCFFKLDHLFIGYNPMVEVTGLSSISFHKKIKRQYVTTYAGTFYEDNNRIVMYNMSEFARAETDNFLQSLQISPTGGLNQNQLRELNFRSCELKQRRPSALQGNDIV